VFEAKDLRAVAPLHAGSPPAHARCPAAHRHPAARVVTHAPQGWVAPPFPRKGERGGRRRKEREGEIEREGERLDLGLRFGMMKEMGIFQPLNEKSDGKYSSAILHKFPYHNFYYSLSIPLPFSH